MPRFVVGVFSLFVMNSVAHVACADDFPSKPLRLVVQGDPGGGLDFLARMIAQEVSPRLGQRVIVDNRPSGIIPGDIVSKAPPDGYTLLLSSNLLWIGSLFERTPYDPIKSFAPLTIATTHPSVLVVTPSFAAKSVAELVALAKAKPGTLNYGSTGVGGTSHLAAELFKALAGVDIVRIPFKGTAMALTSLVGGEIHLMFSSTSSAAPFVHSGRLRVLAVSSAEPSRLAPGAPTVASTVPGYESSSRNTLFLPAKTPASIVKRLNRDIVQALNNPEIRERLFRSGTEVVGSTPEELVAAMKTDMARIGKAMKETSLGKSKR